MNTLYYGDNLKILRTFCDQVAAVNITWHSDGWNRDHPKLQILTVEELLAGKTVDLPLNLDTFKKAAKIGPKADEQHDMFAEH